MANGILIKEPLEEEETAWIATNISHMYYKKVGNLVLVMFNQVTVAANTVLQVTGLPQPKSYGNIFGVALTDADLITNKGYLSYNIARTGWGLYSPSGMTIRGNIMYVAEE
jgi:hypothetical protein